MGWFDTFAHPVHHLHPKIPCYHAYQAQLLLDARLRAAVVRKFGIGWLVDTMRACKLYDWEGHRWLAFDGTPTTGPIRIYTSAGSHSAVRAATSSLARRRAASAVSTK